MSKHTPGPWHFVPWHIEEGQPAVRCAEGWIVAAASNDANAEFIARAPAMEARIAEIEAENERLRQLHVDMKTKLAQYMAWYAMAEHQHLWTRPHSALPALQMRERGTRRAFVRQRARKGDARWTMTKHARSTCY